MPTPTTAPAAVGPAPETIAGVEEWLVSAWAQSVDQAAVQAALQEAGWQKSPDQWRAIDLDGDGRDEWLATLLGEVTRQPDYNPMPWGDPGDLIVVNGSGVIYRFSDGNDTNWVSAPIIWGDADMSGDNRREAILRSGACGAHTCYSFYVILSDHSGAVQNVVLPPQPPLEGSEPAISLSYDEPRLEDATGDGRPDLVLYGGTIGSAGAGLHRARTEVWAWDGQGVSLASSTWDASNYRFHRLYDANDAFAAGDWETAEALYSQVVNDATLEDSAGLLTGESSYDSSRQFAAFRLILLATLQNDTASVQEWQAWFEQNYSGAPLYEAALRLIVEWTAGVDQATACANITNMLLTYENPTGPLADMGYANPSLTAETVCPQPEP